MNAKIKYEFSAVCWQHASPGGWYFISLPKTIAQEIRAALQTEEEGWGRLKATAQIGNSQWKTAIWFDTKQNTYLPPSFKSRNPQKRGYFYWTNSPSNAFIITCSYLTNHFLKSLFFPKFDTNSKLKLYF